MGIGRISTGIHVLLRWPRNVAQGEFSLSNGEYLSYSALLLSYLLEYRRKSCTSKTRFFGHFYLRQRMGLYFNDDDVICPNAKAAEFGEITQNSGHKLRRSELFKVINFDTNGKPVCDFLYVNNSNLSPVVYHFRDMADYW